ncbi:MAG: bacterial Ig-like domain-containing protein [Treponema sp.]|jgi:DNA-binding protein YbaB|nr:bacterial Ig-like domain-containing protein [Treponema sp.]
MLFGNAKGPVFSVRAALFAGLALFVLFAGCDTPTGASTDTLSGTPPAVLVSIAVTRNPEKMYYTVDEAFDPAGLEVTGAYSNGAKKAETGYALSAVDTGSAGTKTVTVAFKGKTASFTVTVGTAELVSIAVTRNPTKTIYARNEALDPAGLEVTGTYSDESGTYTRIETGYNLSVDTGSTGEKTVTVTLNEKTATFEITVNDYALVSIAVTQTPAKTTYERGEAFDPAGLVVTGAYSDGTKKTETGYTLSPVNTGSAGEKTVTVTLSGKTTAFIITVNPAILVSIEVTHSPNYIVYKVGYTFSSFGLVVTGTYTDGTTKTESSSSYTLSGADTSSPGTKTVTVNHLNGKTATFTITVSTAALTSIAVTQKPTKTVYVKDEPFDSAGLEVTGTYSDGSTKIETVYHLGNTNTDRIGSQSVYVSLNAYTVNVPITVNNTALSSIAVTHTPTKTVYTAGEPFLSAGLVVTGTYLDGTTRTENNFQCTLSGADTGSAGTKTVTVTLSGKTATFEITVNPAALVSIAVTQNPDKTTYEKGEPFDSTGLVVTGTYTDGAQKIETGYDLSNHDTNHVGTKYVTVTLSGKTAYFDITVVDTTPPADVTNLTAFYYTRDSIRLTWSNPPDVDFSGVEISMSPAAGSLLAPVTPAKSNTSYTATGLAPGTSYTFTVKSRDTTGNKSAGAGRTGSVKEVSGTAELSSYLISLPSNNAPAGPYLVKLSGIDLSDGSQYLSIYSVLSSRSRYVDLDLSGCTGTSIADLMSSDSTSGKDRIILLTLPDTVKNIGSSAFQDCTGLTSISLPDDVTAIGNAAFQDCTGLTSISLPAAVTIGDYAFRYCTGLTSISLPAAVTIGFQAFLGCTGLTAISLPDVTYIGTGAFSGCTMLTSINLPAVVTLDYNGHGLMGAFYNCTGLTSVSLPAAVTIGDRTFYGCTGLTSISLPAAVTIGDLTFYGCTGLTSVSLPAVTSIGNNAFSSCTSLGTVTMGSQPPSLGLTVFPNNRPNKIYVPAAAVTVYQNTTKAGWTAYLKSIVQVKP